MRREFLLGTVEEYEARHRRRVLIVIGILTLIATSPVLGHHVSTRLGAAFAGQDHFWIVCLVALHQLLAPVHWIFHLLLISGVAYAVSDRVRASMRVRRTLRMLETHRPTSHDPVWHAAVLADVPATSLRVAVGLPNPAFTTGWLRPRIFIDARLQHHLTREQLSTVIAHEFAHVRRRDPARLTLLRALGCTLFWLPALRRLAEDVADDAEIAADDYAVRGDPMVLASAILLLANWPNGRDGIADRAAGVIGFQRDAMLDRRIHRLLGDDAPITTHVTWRSILAASAALMLVWTSGIAVAHPMTAHSTHCQHVNAWSYEHLFCLAGHATGSGAVCPHEHPALR